jgi:hypothetical protein
LFWLLLLDGLFVCLSFGAQMPAFVLRSRVCAIVPMAALGGARVRREKAIFFCPRSTQAADEQRRYEKNGKLVLFWHHEALSSAQMSAIR